MLPTRIFSVPSNSGQSLVLALATYFLRHLGVRVVGWADDDRSADGLAVDLEVDEVVLPSLEADRIGGEGPDLLAVDR